MSSQGGIDALRLDSGESIWSTSRAAKPLLLTAGLLVAQVEDPDQPRILRIVTLDPARGSVLKEGEIELPEEVEAFIDAGLGTLFTVEARVRKSEVVVSWTFTRRHIRGMPRGPLPEEEKGAASFDLDTGKLEVRQLELAEPVDPELPPPIADLVSAKTLPQAPWRAGGVYAWVARPSRDRQAVLKRWAADSGQRLPGVTLFGNELTMRYPAADQRHLLASRATGATSGGEVDYEWNIYSLETGERTAQVILQRPGAWFFMTRSALIHEAQAHDRPVEDGWVGESLSLRAIDLHTGREIWVHPFRDTRYRGPYPPQFPGRDSEDPAPGKGA
jgi:hypothetical protein